MKKTLCVVTGTRAEYGLLKNIIIRLSKNDLFEVKLLVTGSHLSKLHGYTIDQIKKDNIPIDCELDMLLSNDTNISITKSIGIEIMGLSEYFNLNKIDCILVLGDRYEILSVALVATIYQIKIIHICGGDTTEGAYDDDIRNAITQLSHIHLVTCDESKNKILSFGKNNIHVVGNPGLELLHNFIPNDKRHDNYVMFIYHPETKNLTNFDLSVVKKIFDYVLEKNNNLVVIGPNADNKNDEIRNFYKLYKNKIYYYESIDRYEYLSLAYHCDLFIGNSSSGIYEIPFFKKYIINIGDRQKGRRKISNVIDAKYDFEDIKNNIDTYYGKIGENSGSYPILQTSELIEKILIDEL